MRSIIMPPPAPTKPQMKPIKIPPKIDPKIFLLLLKEFIFSLVVMTGLMTNLRPKNKVMRLEKAPMVVEGTKEATHVPTMVKTRTVTIKIHPSLKLMFFFLP